MKAIYYGGQSSEEKLKNETHLGLSEPTVDNRYRADRSANLASDFHLFYLSPGTDWFFQASAHYLLLAHPHYRLDHGIQMPHFQDAVFLMWPSRLHLAVGKVFFPYQSLIFVSNCLGLFYLLLLASLILDQIFRVGPTTSHRIMGAVAVYLLIGMVWSMTYYLAALLIPGAFSIQEPNVRGDTESLQLQLFYFSFVTLTTVGYGDIVAVHPIVQMLAILESVVGKLFPVILIARLVLLQVQSKQKT